MSQSPLLFEECCASVTISRNRFKILGLIISIGFVLSGVCQIRAAEVPPKILELIRTSEHAVNDFSIAIKRCVDRKDTSHVLFSGCIDWHSSVHGQWALTALASKYHRDGRYKNQIDRLTIQDISAEVDYLQRNSNFEHPYGRAWFLRLIMENARLTSSDALITYGDKVAKALADKILSTKPNPFSNSYDSQSWALINLKEYAVFRKDEISSNILSNHIRKHFISPSAIRGGCQPDLDRGQFMGICTNLIWLLAQVEGRETVSRLIAETKALDNLEPVERLRNSHEAGLNFSRAWGLWQAYHLTGDLKIAELYAAHVSVGINRGHYRGSYGQIEHWVAQFGVLALYPLLEAR